LEGRETCFAHTAPEARKAFLATLRPGADLDLRGTPIDRGLLDQLLAAVQSDRGRPTLGDTRFTRAQFNGDVGFDQAQFNGDVGFDQAQFSGDAGFGEARFSGDAGFKGAQFNGNAWFLEAQFSGNAWFQGAQFSRYALFQGARFTRMTVFDRVRFSGDVWFGGTRFGGNAHFVEARFDGDIGFADAEFTGEVEFRQAQFKRTGTFGPVFAVSALRFDGATFELDTAIEAVGAELSCVGTRFAEAVTLRLRRTQLVLDGAVFAKPSTIAFAPQPFMHHDPTAGRDVQTFGEGPVAQADGGRRSRPQLLSLRGVDVATLTVSDLDLAACLFQGAHHLDQLRIEGARPFADTPAAWRLRLGRRSVPVWRRWSQRQTLAEEHHWRSAPTSPPISGHGSRLTRPGWHGLACQTPRWVGVRTGQEVQRLGPDRLAVLYRALRKAQEDSKNEPGAADFYYGEMEMRRRDRHTPWAERVVVWLYWLVSGYGLRGLRALAWLAAVVIGLAGLLQAIGFNGGDPGFRDAVIYAAQSTVSIASSNTALTEHVSWAGEVLRIVLRLAGPVLLGLALLAVRNRVKR
jgi:Pentapeptide repeats (9 copies)